MTTRTRKAALAAALVAITGLSYLGLTKTIKSRPASAAAPASATTSSVAHEHTCENCTHDHSADAGTATASAFPRPTSSEKWQDRLLLAHMPDHNALNREVIARFKALAESNAALPPAAELAELARARRAALKELIKADPAAAWDAMLSAEARDRLPAAVQALLETPIDTKGNWEVYAICHPEQAGFPISGYNEAVFNAGTPSEQRLFGFPLGALAKGETSTQVPLLGYNIDDVAVFVGEPRRELVAGELAPANTPIVAVDPISQRTVKKSPLTAQGTVASDTFAYFNGKAIVLFENLDNLRTYAMSRAADANSLAASDEPAATDSGDGTAEAPTAGPSGEREGTGFSVKGGGSATGGLSINYRTLLWMRVRYADDNPNTEPGSENGAYDLLKQVNDHLITHSFGRHQIMVTVTPVLTLPLTRAQYEADGTNAVSRDGATAAAALGYNVTQYGHRVYTYNGGPGTFGGLAGVSANPGNIWIRSRTASVVEHEIGHNLRLQHANGWNPSGREEEIGQDTVQTRWTGRSTIGPGDTKEYSGRYCIMGSGVTFDRTSYFAYQRVRMGWLKTSEYFNATQDGLYRIYADDMGSVEPGKQYALQYNQGARGSYWFEYRKLFTSNPESNGLIVSAQGDGWAGTGGAANKPCRINNNWWSPDFEPDSPIAIGQTFSDFEHGFHITPIARSNDRDWIDAVVRIGHFPENRAPEVTVSASATSAAVNSPITFTATATDPDGDPLAYHWYFDDREFHRERTHDLTTISRSFAAAGVYNVILTVSDFRGGLTIKRVEITVGTPPASQVTLRGRVTDDAGNPIQGVAIMNAHSALESSPIWGRFRSTITDADGNYTLGRVPVETYTLFAFRDYAPYEPAFTNPVVVNADLSNLNFTRAGLRLVASTNTLAENGGTATLRIERTGPSTAAFDSINIRTLGDAVRGTDYSLTPGPGANNRYTLPAGQAALTLTLTGTNDTTAEGAEDIIFTLAMSDGTTTKDTLDLTKRGVAKIDSTTHARLRLLDDDTPLPNVNLTVIEPAATENGGTARIRFTRRGNNTNGALPVAYTLAGTASPSDYTSSSSGSLLIPDGSAFADLTFTGTSDSLSEGSETIRVTLAPGAYLVGTANTAEVRITDAETPVVSLSVIDGIASEIGASTATIRFTRSGTTTNELVVDYAVSGSARCFHGADYEVLGGRITIPAGAAFADLPIRAIPDAINEGIETVTLALSSDESAYLLHPTLSTASISITEVPDVIIAAPTDLTLTPSLGTAFRLNWSDTSVGENNYVVERAASPDGPWTVLATLPANTTTYLDSGLTRFNSYSYRLRVVGPGLEATTTTATGTVNLVSLSRLTSFSSQARIQSESDMVSTFTIRGTGTIAILVRGLGPKLAETGLTGALPDPRIELLNSSGTVLATSDNWAPSTALTTATSRAGAPALTTGSNDAALTLTLPAGTYAVRLSSADGQPGIGAIQIYEATALVLGAPPTQLISASTLARTDNTADALTSTFKLFRGNSRSVLLRAIGPGLTGEPLALADPALNLRRGANPIASNDDWPAALASLFTTLGASPLTPGSKDSALSQSLLPETYTVQVVGQGETASGETSLELYLTDEL